MHVRPFPAPSPSRMHARLALAAAVCLACAIPPPATWSRFSSAISDWSSIVLAALPYIVIGAVAAGVTRRLFRRRTSRSQIVAALFAVFNPGCDCALNGFAGALARARPALAGFALTFAASASPVSLVVTYAAFGARMAIVRAGGALLAAALTALAWSKVHGVVGHASHAHGQPMVALLHLDDLAAALRGIALAACAAIAAKALIPSSILAHLHPTAAALFGALLSPCSTADPLLAAALLRDPHAQLVFMLAAQCLDVRQMLLLHRHFGVAKMAAAAVCAATACAVATTFA
jgi:uncharacterized membrane protein YraQ (UPF0718 family)